ncbi:putative baseplate assembly protein [Ferribacterium limneticum]|uniref:putative baseplate assembly protein n=1 Tax=Ferribacterium limneticum TaxID=76259 RepID=UPI001CF98F8B|nr:putative baseplate assembly protein [Ferribacterium limneticum]UCV17580.1 putative baseplate assembly protein [Ferribacterium limneticum]
MSTSDNCGCCAGVTPLTPVDDIQPPGQPALALRVGTHGRFRQSMLADLADEPALESLTTRASDDPAIALLDSWAAVLDVLSFYQERIGNENYLRTATERRSVLELARAIGYELRPGVAASTWLAFTLETAPGAPLETRIDIGARAQSVPGQDETAQTFETLEAIDAKVRWNSLPVLAAEAVPPRMGLRTIYLAGTATRLQAGDALLIVGDERAKDPGNENWDFRRVTRLREVLPADPSDPKDIGYTVVTLDRGLGKPWHGVHPARTNPRCYALRARAHLFGHNAPDWRAMPANLRATYLGMDDDARPPISQHPEWPGFTLADISDPPAGSASGTGLLGQYYRGKGFRELILSRTDATVDSSTWTGGSPHPSVPTDNFCARWSGWVEAPSSGLYTFYATIDDGVRLWIDGELLINDWTDTPGVHTCTVSLRANHKHDIRLEFYENAGGATCQLAWSGPGVTQAIIPAARLYPRDIHTVHLDASYPKWLADGWAVMSIPNYEEVYRIVSTEDDARADFTVSATATRLTLSGENLRDTFNNHVRSTTAFGQSEPLDWATRPLSGFLQGHLIDLASYEPDLPEGRWLAISGLVLADVPANAKALSRLKKGDALAAIRIARDRKTANLEFEDFFRLTVALAPAAEIVRIQHNDSTSGRTQLLLDSDLTHAYLPSTVRINANLAPASAGDSKQMRIQPEPLGSGDGSRSLQRFALRQGPLTYITAATPSGTASTLEIRVDGLLWQEAPRFTAPGPTERAYTVKLDENGSATVQFGDGVHGTRLPTGSGNVEARYRVGLGTAGNVKAEQISMLLTRPPGLKAVTNPVAASGGTNAEAGDEARRNAPLRVRTLDRIVSLRDFEDFAAAFTGIGKAQAVWLWDGEQRMVHLTVAGTDGAPLDPNAALYRNLLVAIDGARPPYQPLRVSPSRDLRFGLTAGLWIAADYEAEKVLAAASQALATAFGFAARAFGQPVTGSEVLAALQGVAGVIGADLDKLIQVDSGLTILTSNGPDGSIPARSARWQGNSLQPADLLLIDPTAVTLTERTS